jgi:hypothetical protein
MTDGKSNGGGATEFDALRAELAQTKAELAQARAELERLQAGSVTVSHDVTPTGQLVVHVVTPMDPRGELAAEAKARSLALALGILQRQGFAQVTPVPVGPPSAVASPSSSPEAEAPPSSSPRTEPPPPS